jgi:hypothetical protein
MDTIISKDSVRKHMTGRDEMITWSTNKPRHSWKYEDEDEGGEEEEHNTELKNLFNELNFYSDIFTAAKILRSSELPHRTVWYVVTKG